MKRMILALAVTAVAIGSVGVAALAATGSKSTVSAAPADPVWVTLLAARQGTAKYHDVHQAIKDGYHQVSACVMDPTKGVMGVHYLNDAYVKDPAITAAKPELLLYAPQTGGRLKLVAVEYFRPDADQNLSTDPDRPVLAGVKFDGPMEGHDPGMPRHYDLHVWVWTWNPAGVFAQFNPSIHC
jgi:hypothetical protein